MLLELRYSSLLLLFLNNDVFIFNELYYLWHAEFVCGGGRKYTKEASVRITAVPLPDSETWGGSSARCVSFYVCKR